MGDPGDPSNVLRPIRVKKKNLQTALSALANPTGGGEFTLRWGDRGSIKKRVKKKADR